MVELADTQDLKSCGGTPPYRFEPGLRHGKIYEHHAETYHKARMDGYHCQKAQEARK